MFIILFTLLIALLLDIAPFPVDAIFMPEWTLLTLIYWIMALPLRINIGIAWITGLIMDIIKDTPMGLYALCMLGASLFVSISHQRLRYYSMGQQCLAILLITGLFQLFSIWFRGSATISHGIWSIGTPLVSALCWPLIYYSLRSLRRSFRIL